MSVVAEMSTLHEELIFLILQFFEEKGLKQSAHMLGQESKLYFDMNFFENKILSGKWDEAEMYLSCFTDVNDNRYSTKIYFEMRKQSFLEALDNHDRAKALEILMKDLKVFAPGHERLLQEMTLLLTIDDIRENASLSTYGDTESARKTMMLELKKIIMANPLLCGKLDFPNIRRQRLCRLINQSLNWQHLQCTYPLSVPDISTLYEDHVCPPQAELRDKNPPPSQGAAVPVPISSTSWNSSPSTVSDPEISKGSVGWGSPTNLASTDGLEASALISSKRPLRTMEEVTSTVHSDHHDKFPDTEKENEIVHECCTTINKHDLPRTVARVLKEVSSPTCMDFHPIQQTVLLVGTSTGDIALWDIKNEEKLVSRDFHVWNIRPCSMSFKAAMLKDSCVFVNRVTWTPDGSSFGVAYSKHIVQLYSCHGGNDVKQQLEIDAHAGGVNDLAFSSPEKQLLVITCGDDKTIKVWDAVSGIKRHTFEGHDAPVYSVCAHSKEDIHFIFSTSVDGKIKVWLYDDMGARVDYEAPGLGCTVMAYGADDRRLFSCGTSKEGESFLVEWNESEGSIKKRYKGLEKNSSAVVQFDVSKSELLAAGDDHVIKFWDIENDALLTTVKAGGGLPANPNIRFNKEGWLLAVIANGNKIKIFATDSGLKLLHISENYSALTSGVLSDTLMEREIDPVSNVYCAGVADGGIPMYVESKNFEDTKSESTGSCNENLNGWKVLKIDRPQCRSLIPPHLKAHKISRLIYTNMGNGILALLSNAMHLLWKWPQNNCNLNDEETAEILPQLWQPRGSSRLMINDLARAITEETVSCFALSKNDSYLMSASGGKFSLFNLLTFKTMTTIMPPPPVATCVAFYPEDNNVVAIGMNDCTIIIYNVRLAKVIGKLESHSEPVTGLAFSNVLNVLVSSGADALIVLWNVDGWGKQKSRFLQIPPIKKIRATLSDTFIQFHQDQTHLLVVHETHFSIFEAKNLQCVKQWVPGNSTSISHATFSSDGQIVYTCLMDGTISIFDASNLQLHCQIVATEYLPPSSSSINVYPCVIAAHPHKPTQFAVGLTDGGVVVIEPPKPGGKWGLLPLD